MIKPIKYRDIFTINRGIFNGVNIPLNIPIIHLNAIILSRVGQRELTQIVKEFLSFDDDTPYINDDNLEVLTAIINSLYNDKWIKLYNTLSLEYDAKNNYKRIETETITVEGDENLTGSENTQNKVFGYDTENATNDKSENVSTTNSTTTTNERNRNLTVSGKMGGTSYQSLIREELRLRRDNVLADIILDDVKYFSTMSIY